MKRAALLLTLAVALSACGTSTTDSGAQLSGETIRADDQDDGEELTSTTFTLSPVQPPTIGAQLVGTPPPAPPLTVTLSIQTGTAAATLGKKKASAKFTYGPRGTISGTVGVSLENAAGVILDVNTTALRMTAPSPKGLDHISGTKSTKYTATGAATCAVLSYALQAPEGVYNSAVPVRVCESANDAKTALEAASSGLIYLSESDSAWTHVQLSGPAMQGLPTAAGFTSLIGMDRPGVEQELVEFGPWFDRLTVKRPGDAAWNAAAKRYAALRKVFARSYRELRVYRVRDTLSNGAEWRVYVLGVNAFGVSGLWATSIET